jgi:hypothetical protein
MMSFMVEIERACFLVAMVWATIVEIERACFLVAMVWAMRLEKDMGHQSLLCNCKKIQFVL